MAELKEYSYVVNGVATTGMLNEHDATAMGAVLVTKSKAAPVAATPVVPVHPDVKARTDVHTAARTVPNKGR